MIVLKSNQYYSHFVRHLTNLSKNFDCITLSLRLLVIGDTQSRMVIAKKLEVLLTALSFPNTVIHVILVNEKGLKPNTHINPKFSNDGFDFGFS